MRHRIRPSISFEACLPRKAKEPPNGPGWIYEIKHDGFRILARKDGNRVKLITRNGYDFADRYRLIVDGIASLPVETCIIDGEAIVVDQNGLSIFTCSAIASTITRQPYSPSIFLNSMVRPCGERKQHLAWALRERHHGIALNATYDGDGAVIYEHACTLGCEGIVSKQLGSPYCAGRTDQ